jgi:SAM-dependent methyltransferase
MTSSCGCISPPRYGAAMPETAEEYDAVYLATDDPRLQSGFRGSAERWRAARGLIATALEAPGTFLDVGCANGLLMESVAEWSGVEPYGVDFAPGLVELARRRLPQWADRISHGDITVWSAPFKFDYVHARLDNCDPQHAVRLGKRAIFSSDGSYRRPDSPKAVNVGDALRALGYNVAGEAYRRDHRHLVELSVAWVDSD